MQYLLDALDLIQNRAYYVRFVQDWDALMARAQASAAGAQSPTDCYPAIREVLEALGDDHSWFIGADELDTTGPRGKPLRHGIHILSPEFVIFVVFPDSPADKAGIQPHDVVEKINGSPPEASQERLIQLNPEDRLHLQLRRDGQSFEVELEAAPIEKGPMPRGYLLRETIGYVELFGQGWEREAQQYVDTAQQTIRELMDAGAKCWIVDLRRNTGGNMWPMLAGVGPLLGEGTLGAFVDETGKDLQTWHYESGASWYNDPETHERVGNFQATHPVRSVDLASTPVAVLTSDLTASSGEMTLVAFLGRPKTRTFGQTTEGVTTAIYMHTLEDGAILGIAESVCADRTGKTYDSVIEPDEKVSIEWQHYGTLDDPVIKAAAEWLEGQRP
jgi:carboxyl-terminal processing protease